MTGEAPVSGISLSLVRASGRAGVYRRWSALLKPATEQRGLETPRGAGAPPHNVESHTTTVVPWRVYP